jgi:ATP-dependent helicase YprA (DUF1998 family)
LGRRLPDPEFRLNMLFSATLSHRVLELAYEHMNDPELIRIEPERITAELVRQVIYYPAMEEKASLLVHLMRKGAATRTMVFVNTKRLAERLERLLRANGVAAAAMSGDVPQRKRMRMLREFHDGKLAALVAPMSPHAACTLPTSAMSSITTCPRIRRTTCIASAARHGRARRETRSVSAASSTSSRCRRSRRSSGSGSPSAVSTRPTCPT